MILGLEGVAAPRACERASVQPCLYSIVVEGELGPRYRSVFGGMLLEPGGGRTAIVGEVHDQAELHGLLDEVAALGLALVSVSPVGPEADR